MSVNLSVRLDDALAERVRVRARAAGETLSDRLRSYAEEGARRDEHPMITFRDGPTGRRAGLIGGPDVWEVAMWIDDATDGTDNAATEPGPESHPSAAGQPGEASQPSEASQPGGGSESYRPPDPVAELVADGLVSRAQADAALAYRRAYPDEIDARIDLHWAATRAAETTAAASR